MLTTGTLAQLTRFLAHEKNITYGIRYIFLDFLSVV